MFQVVMHVFYLETLPPKFLVPMCEIDSERNVTILTGQKRVTFFNI
jgi:hypothetical protein